MQPPQNDWRPSNSRGHTTPLPRSSQQTRVSQTPWPHWSQPAPAPEDPMLTLIREVHALQIDMKIVMPIALKLNAKLSALEKAWELTKAAVNLVIRCGSWAMQFRKTILYVAGSTTIAAAGLSGTVLKVLRAMLEAGVAALPPG